MNGIDDIIDGYVLTINDNGTIDDKYCLIANSDSSGVVDYSTLTGNRYGLIANRDGGAISKDIDNHSFIHNNQSLATQGCGSTICNDVSYNYKKVRKENSRKKCEYVRKKRCKSKSDSYRQI
jgi:hypothetical protein